MTLRRCRKHGFKLVPPNDSQAWEYFRNAEETLNLAVLTSETGSRMWIAAQKYYLEYLAAYAILIKLGIKARRHECTIEIIYLLEKENIIPFAFGKMLEEDKQLRIDNQYFLKNMPVEFDAKYLAHFLLSVKEIIENINAEDIERIRKVIYEDK